MRHPFLIRRALGRNLWGPPQTFGPMDWSFIALAPNRGQVLVSQADFDGTDYIHASIARPDMPTYQDLDLLHKACFDGYAYQVFAPPEHHVNIHNTALHLWGRADGKPVLPDFSIGAIEMFGMRSI